MKNKKIPMRTCVVTKEIKPKRDMIRIVADKENNVSVDHYGKKPGRGAYLTLSEEVIIQAIKTNALERKLNVKIPESIYEELLKIVK
ncbi:MAG: YlxR family protein [Acholeplasmataceae bacterium]|jgi:predicted RNA-binding protein YlxR (DUF448 family)|nr:YlxR family protein [Acholeplasmataceae bacterium]